MVRDEDGKIIIGSEEKLLKWHKYVGPVINDDRSPVPTDKFTDWNGGRPPITVEEVECAIIRQN